MQQTIWGGFLASAVENKPYVSFKDKKPHCLKFTTNKPKQTKDGKYGPEMVASVEEMGIDKLISITQPMAREIRGCCVKHAINVDKMKGHVFTITRQGKGYTTFYEVMYNYKEEKVE